MKKKLYAIVLSVAMLLSIGSVGAFTAFAHNYGNSTFSFGFAPSSTSVQYTPTRTKEDYTSSWMKLEEIGGDYSPSYTASVVSGDKSNFSQTWYYTFNSSDLNQGRYLKNNAKEDNPNSIPYVRIKAKASSVHGFYANGVWSPDSIQ